MKFNFKRQGIFTILILVSIGFFGIVNFSNAEEIKQVYLSDIFDLGGDDYYDIDMVKWQSIGDGELNIYVRAHSYSDLISNSDWTLVENNVTLDIDDLNNKQYIQYKAEFVVNYSENSLDENLSLSDLTIKYIDSGYPDNQEIESSIFDTEDNNTIINSISWNEIKDPDNSYIKKYIRTSDNSDDMGDWVDIDLYCSDDGDTMNCDLTNVDTGDGKKFLQYKLRFRTHDNESMEIDNIIVDYESNTETPLLNEINVSIADLYEVDGVYTSSVYDTMANQSFGEIALDKNEDGGTVKIKIRSCDKSDCSDGTNWSGCLVVGNKSDVTNSNCVIDGERYLQYYLSFKQNNNHGTSPSVGKVEINFDRFDYMPIGSGITVQATVNEEGSSLETAPIVQILDENNNQVGDDYILYDDGYHSDGSASDNKYGTVAISVGCEVGAYKIKIIAKDIFGNEYNDVVGHFATIEGEGGCENDDLPDTFDWRNNEGEDWMTSIKNQGLCGACWAFATIGVAEAKWNIQESNPELDVNLSEQYLVSDCCVLTSGNYTSPSNCRGGRGGFGCNTTSEECTTYDESFTNCTYNSSDSACNWEPTKSCNNTCSMWDISDYDMVNPPSDQDVVKGLLMEKGPLYMSLNAAAGNFIETEGVWGCNNDEKRTNHAVVLVGWNDYGEYWIVKNSWGLGWGDDGYFNLKYKECNSTFRYYLNKVIAPTS